MSKIENIKSKIIKLQKVAMDKAATENEISNAIKTLQNLCLKYHIELTDLDENENKQPVFIKEILSTGRFMWYDEYLLNVLQKYFFVSIYKKRKGNQTVVDCIGYEEDYLLFNGCYVMISNIMKTTFKKKKNKIENLNRNEYYKGFIESIRNEMDKNKAEKEKEWALIPVNEEIEAIKKSLSLRTSNKSGIKPKFNSDINSFTEGYKEGKNAYDTYKNKGKTIE